MNNAVTRMTSWIARSMTNMNVKQFVKRILLGRQINDGLIFRIIIYAILISASILYLNPLLYMISTSLQNLRDLLDPAVNWIPTQLELDNYVTAFQGLAYNKAFLDTLTIALIPSVIQVLSCAITGYAFARLHVPGKNILFLLVLLTFLVPQEILIIPLLMWYSKIGWLNSMMPFIIPALFSQGLKAPLFIIIFRQFFAKLPHELEESARIDGAGAIRTYARVMFPLAKPAMLVVFILSFVWHWNDLFHTTLFIRGHDILALPIQMDQMQARLNRLAGDVTGAGDITIVDLNEPVKMAASVLIILPPLLLYMFTQKYFVRGVERSGLVE